MLPCARHPQRQADYDCPLCRVPLCRECTPRAEHGDTIVYACPKCGRELDRIHLGPEAEPPAARVVRGPSGTGGSPFFEQMDAIVVFPWRQTVLLTLVGLLAVTTPIYWFSIGSLAAGIGVGLARCLEIGVYFRLVVQTAQGKEEIGYPDAENLWDDFLAPMLRYLVALAPIVVGFVWMMVASRGRAIDAAMGGDPSAIFDEPVAAALLLGGIALLPLFTIVAAVSQSALAVLNPLVWWHVLRTTRGSYVAGAFFFYLVFGLETVVLVPVLAASALSQSSFLVIAASSAVGYLSMAYRARVLGAICRPYLDQLTG